jgi:regulator of protease activity HflC (stomatin/prohibitin superfamily)
MSAEAKMVTKIVAAVCLVAALVAGVYLFVSPMYRVYQQDYEGRAELARAQQNRQIRVQEAQAKLDSAELEAKAEVLRAEGLAKANDILAQSLNGPEGYLRYLYIQALSEHAGKMGQIIYVPTEAGLPILETSRLKVGH